MKRFKKGDIILGLRKFITDESGEYWGRSCHVWKIAEEAKAEKTCRQSGESKSCSGSEKLEKWKWVVGVKKFNNA